MRCDKNYIFKPSVLIIVPIQHVTVVNPCNFNYNRVLYEILMISLFWIKVWTMALQMLYSQQDVTGCHRMSLSQDVTLCHGISWEFKRGENVSIVHVSTCMYKRKIVAVIVLILQH